MRKIFFFFAAMLVALTASAATTTVENTSFKNNLQSAITAATAGDILELGDDVYYENGDFSINKSLTIRAAAGAHPVISQLYYYKIEGGAQVTFQGIEFDGATYKDGAEADVTGAYSHCFRSYSSSTGEEVVTFENCEFHHYPSYVLYTQKHSRKWHSLTVRNCYFHDNDKHAIAINYESSTATTCDEVTVENSTFANTTGDYRAILIQNGNTTTLSVNKCTFYNYGGKMIELGASVTTAAISNCIFANPASKSSAAVFASAGTVTKCLRYNSGECAGVTVTGELTSDPKFIDAANGDFHLDFDSPARKAGTESANLGASRWWPLHAVTTHAIDFGDVEQGAEAAASFNLKGVDLTANVRVFDFTLPYGAVFSKYPAAVTPEEAAYTNGKKVDVYASTATVGEYNGLIVLESPDFENDTITLHINVVEPAPAMNTIYFKAEQDWWNYDYENRTAAGAYAWGEGVEANAAWPGVRMEKVEGEEYVWKIELEAKYTKVIFTRVNGSGDIEHKGLKTVDLTIPTDGKNLYTMTRETIDWGNIPADGIAEGAWSVYAPAVYTLEDGFYLIGKFNNVDEWDVASLSAAKKFTWNKTVGENNEEWKIVVDLVDGDKIKAAYVYHDAITSYYPDGEGNEYVVDASHAGNGKTIYFQQLYNNEWGGHFYIDANDPTAIGQTTNDQLQTTKLLRDGQVLIIRDGKTYNVIGLEVR